MAKLLLVGYDGNYCLWMHGAQHFLAVGHLRTTNNWHYRCPLGQICVLVAGMTWCLNGDVFLFGAAATVTKLELTNPADGAP